MIRQLDIVDPVIVQQVLTIQLPAYKVEAEMIGSNEIPALQDTVATLQLSKEQFYGFYLGEVLAGVISFQILDDTLDIHRLIVHPTYFRKGIGKTLIQFVMDKYRNKVSSYIVRTGTVNIPALKLYTSLGFQEEEQIVVQPSVSLTKLKKSI